MDWHWSNKSNLSSDDFGIQDDTLPRTNIPLLASDLQYQAALIIWKVWPPCILLLGGFGNIATIFVMRRIKDDNSSQHAILMALAISDLTLLCTDMTSVWVRQVFYVNVQTLHIVLCKISWFTALSSGTTSAWLVTCVTVQRTMAVLWPHRMRVMCTVRRTRIVIATVVLTVCAFYFHLVVGSDIMDEDMCWVVSGMYQQFVDFIFPWMDLCVASILPYVCLIVCDIRLSVTLFKAVSSSSITTHAESNVSTDSRKKTSYRMTVMILAISCAFLVLTLPELIYMIWVPYVYEELTHNPKTLASAYLIHSLTYTSWYINSAINFYLYCLTGTKFRREFVSWIRCGAHNPSAPSVSFVSDTASETSRGGRQRHGNGQRSK